MTLLQLVQEFCRRTGITSPSIVMSSQDDDLLQLVGLLNEGCEDLLRHSWTELQYSAAWTSTGVEDQGALSTLAPSLDTITNNTILDTTTDLRIVGPMSPAKWQDLESGSGLYAYRIMAGHLHIRPALPVSHTLAFGYTSRGIVQDVSTVTPTTKSYFTRDDDVFLLNEVLLLTWLRWKWKEEKGLPYLENFRAYEAMVAKYSGADGTKATLSLNGEAGIARPGIVVPAGNWSVP